MNLSQTFKRLKDRTFDREIETLEPKPVDALSATQKKLASQALQNVQKTKSTISAHLHHKRSPQPTETPK